MGPVGVVLFAAMSGAGWVAGLPRRVLNSVGLGYQDRFEIGGKSIVRPDHFATKPHRHAFDEIGRYILHPGMSDLMDLYFPRSFWKEGGTSTQPYLTPIEHGKKHGVTSQIWDEVLSFFAEQGVIEKRWRLYLPLASGGYVCPDWDKTGKYPPRRDPLSGKVDLRDFYPGFMSEEEMNALIGEKYPKNYADRLRGELDDWVMVLPSSFDPVYYRPREMALPKKGS